MQRRDHITETIRGVLLRLAEGPNPGDHRWMEMPYTVGQGIYGDSGSTISAVALGWSAKSRTRLLRLAVAVDLLHRPTLLTGLRLNEVSLSIKEAASALRPLYDEFQESCKAQTIVSPQGTGAPAPAPEPGKKTEGGRGHPKQELVASSSEDESRGSEPSSSEEVNRYRRRGPSRPATQKAQSAADTKARAVAKRRRDEEEHADEDDKNDEHQRYEVKSAHDSSGGRALTLVPKAGAAANPQKKKKSGHKSGASTDTTVPILFRYAPSGAGPLEISRAFNDHRGCAWKCRRAHVCSYCGVSGHASLDCGWYYESR